MTDYFLRVKEGSPNGTPGDEWHFTDDPVTPPPVEQRTLTVVDGTGSGTYDEGTAVDIGANAAPTGEQFNGWTRVTGNGAFENATLPATKYTLMGTDATVQATFAAVPEPPPAGSGWDERPDTKLESVMVTWADPETQGNPLNITRAWSGGAHDTQRDRLFIWGGGHADYSGNEVYYYDVGVETWIRATEPSDWGGDFSNSTAVEQSDGRPVACHSRDNLVYNDTLDAVIVMGPADLWRDSHGSPATWSLSTGATIDWTRLQDTTAGGRGASGVDAVGNTYIASEGNAEFGVMDTNGNWTYYPINGDPKLTWKIAGCVDRNRNVFVVAGNGQTWEADLGNLSAGLNLVGTCPWADPPGLVYAPSMSMVVGWNGGEPYTYNGTTWTQLNGANSSSPDPLPSFGVYGRLGYSQSKHALVYCGLPNQNVWLYHF